MLSISVHCVFIYLNTLLPFRAVYTHFRKNAISVAAAAACFYLHRFCEGRPVSYQLPLTAPISWRSLATTLPPCAAPAPALSALHTPLSLPLSSSLYHLQKNKSFACNLSPCLPHNSTSLPASLSHNLSLSCSSTSWRQLLSVGVSPCLPPSVPHSPCQACVTVVREQRN